MKMQVFLPAQIAASNGYGPATAIEQTPFNGHEGEDRQPLDLYLASLGTCASLYALRFCTGRNLETNGMSIEVVSERGRELSRLAAIKIQINLPPGFPERYREAIARASGQCRFKQHVYAPPRFEIKALPAPEPVDENVDLGYEEFEIAV